MCFIVPFRVRWLNQKSDPCSSRLAARAMYSPFSSIPILRQPFLRATSATVPEPMNGSHTVQGTGAAWPGPWKQVQVGFQPVVFVVVTCRPGSPHTLPLASCLITAGIGRVVILVFSTTRSHGAPHWTSISSKQSRSDAGTSLISNIGVPYT